MADSQFTDRQTIRLRVNGQEVEREVEVRKLLADFLREDLELTALYEHAIYDENDQFLTGTLMDYLVPTAADVPRVEIGHIVSPSPYTPGGIKGMGEGGAIAPPAAVANAIADALSPFGVVRINEIPLTPERVLAAIERGRSAA